MFKRVLISSVIFFVTPSMALAWSWDDLWPWGSDNDACKYSRELKSEIAFANDGLLKVAAGAGMLDIQGDNTDVIQIEATLCSSDKDVLAQLDVIDKVEGDDLLIRTDIPKDSSGWTQAQSKIDLKLIVPKEARLDVWDSSGSAGVSNVASLEMVDSSGSLEIESIAGDVNVRDSSGSIEIETVGGDVQVSDSSGSIDVSDVEGNFTVLVDSSGSIEGRRISKDMIVKVDSSGSIRARQVGGDFIVEQDGSGGIRHEDVAGTVSLPNY